MAGPPPPYFLIALFPAMAVSAGIVIRSIGNAVARLREARQPLLAPAAPDPRVPQMQAEIDELRTQVERLQAAQSFYAQLGAGDAPAHAALPREASAPLS
jgi:hypothetical protein